ncbi:GDP-mannose 4,6-dehydratase [Bradyrhizobium erythrophlei]|uniref:GDP-mannose 4,6-dehydratase n=1 Tax=Bradyrhizobium erythrophlei TaxID=1437360 RepID=UPI0009A81385|nr:GDP-mannose 4,6-dehydratase [Bradyrhizobium erythrophlei]
MVSWHSWCCGRRSGAPASPRVQTICGKSLVFVDGGNRAQAALEHVLTQYGCTAVMHFAGLKSVRESVTGLLKYYDYNAIGSHRLLSAMQKRPKMARTFGSGH